MKTKKIPYYLFLGALTTGASLTLGFLSFTGAMALWPVMGIGLSFFVLSVVYEGEIYLQNIKGALNKLFKHNYIRRQIAREFLLKHLPAEISDTDPEFLRDYAELLQQEQALKEGVLNAYNRKKLKKIQKSLKQAEIFFSDILLPTTDQQNISKFAYISSLQKWMDEHEAEKYQSRFENRKLYYRISFLFSALSGLLMGFGTIYLLTSGLLSIAFFAAMPLPLLGGIIALGAFFSGLAYVFLTYNSLTDMINNDTLNKWYRLLKEDLTQNFGIRSIFMAVTAIGLTALSLVLTVCTAGTWWTIVKETPQVFNWMKRIPAIITGAIMPFFLGLSALVFNIENGAETLDSLNDVLKNAKSSPWNFFKEIIHTIKHVWQNETFLQVLNPFRFLLKITYTPLRILLFLGHLLSIAVTSDRVPGMPEVLSAILGFLQEGFTDVNYFFQTGEPASAKTANERFQQRLGGAADHDNDIPSLIIKWLFSPLFASAALWQFSFSNKPYNKAQLKICWQQQFGTNDSHSDTDHSPLQTNEVKVTNEFKVHMALSRLKQWRCKNKIPAFSEASKQLYRLETQLQTASEKETFGRILKRHEGIDPGLFAKLKKFDIEGTTSTVSTNYEMR